MYFNLKDYDGAYLVKRTENGICVENMEHELNGKKVMDKGMHIYSVCFKTNAICLGPDFVAWKDGTADFHHWANGNYDALRLRIDGEVYDVEGIDRSWPKPKLFKDGILKGYIDYSYDIESGTTMREPQWTESNPGEAGSFSPPL